MRITSDCPFIDPKLIDVDSLSLYNLCNYLPEANECYAIIDIGHEKTSICVVKDSMLRMFRTINLGGRYFTEFLSRDLQVSYSEAQRLKHKVSRITVGNDQGEGLSPEDLKVSHSLTKASNTLIKELGRTVYAFKTWDKAPIKGLYLSGASIKIQNFSTLIEENLRVDAVNDEIQQSDLKIKDHLLEDME